MVAAQRLKTSYTEEEYLALEEKAKSKSEYYRGQIFAMSGGSLNHSRIASNVIAALGNGLRGSDCEALTSDIRIRIEAHKLYTYADVTVLCGHPRFWRNRTDTITNPTLIVEVLSPSTRDYDRGQKFEFYRTLASLRDYVLMHQDQPFIEYYHKGVDGQWRLTEVRGLESTLVLQAVEVELPLQRIYERVEGLSENPVEAE